MTRVLLAVLVVVGCGCKKGGEWLVGRWLLLDPDGKPGVCHEFKRDRTLAVYTSSECRGAADQTSSGRWDDKGDGKLALIRYNERKAQLVLVTERDPERFVARGALAGTMFRVGEGGTGPLLAQLESKGLIKVRALAPRWGCLELATPLGELRALPKEAEPRMLRQKDQALEYRAGKSPGEPTIEKVVYALGAESLDWVALHLSAEAFAPPGPQQRLEQQLGKPQDAVATGTGERRQHIVMWKAYCASGEGGVKKDVDVTLFATAGSKRATVYVSENVVSSLWEDLKHVAADKSAQASDDDDGADEGGTAKPAVKKEPAAAKDAPPAKKDAPAKDDDDI